MSTEKYKDRFEFIVNTSKEFMTLINKDYVYEAANKSYLYAHDKKLEDILGSSVADVWGQELFEKTIKSYLDECLTGKELEYESWFNFPVLGRRCFEVRLYPYSDDLGTITHCVVVSRDITERKTAESKLVFLAYHDDLTGLGNRKLFVTHLDRQIKHAEREKKIIAVFSIHLDNFNTVNDTLGHDAADQLLVQCGGVLKTIVRSTDEVARINGNEFLLFNEIKKSSDITRIVNSILNNFKSPFTLKVNDRNNPVTVKASIGICLYPSDGDDADTLIKHAYVAMNQAEKQGSNSYILFNTEINHRLVNIIEMEKDLDTALKECHFETYYQPKVNADNKITGVEALIRWHHPEKGMVSPADFIPVAEKSGLISPIGFWVLNEACLQNQIWQKNDKTSFRVSVNLSPYQLRDPSLLATIRETLDKTGLPPELLELEITETGAMAEIEKNLEILHEIHRMGIKISIDDFGTGYSSLSKLTSLPIDILKIDKSFIDKIPDDEQAVITVVAIINLARSLGLETVAEGVETKEQFDFLVDKGVQQIQGYYFSKPLKAEEMDSRIEGII